ncbi:MAG TPA: hypothetical protein V6D11_28520 [Waterburya sp.]|jgi:hypothetical protein
MKRRISLVIAFALSFLMMFSSIARAGETKVQITVTASESVELEVIKVPLAETDHSDSPSPQVKVKVQVLEGEKPPEKPPHDRCSIQCTPNVWGSIVDNECVPCPYPQ